MNIAGRRNTSNTSSVGRQEETDDLYARKKHLLGFLTHWVSPGQCWQCAGFTLPKTTGSLVAVLVFIASNLSVILSVTAENISNQPQLSPYRLKLCA